MLSICLSILMFVSVQNCQHIYISIAILPWVQGPGSGLQTPAGHRHHPGFGWSAADPENIHFLNVVSLSVYINVGQCINCQHIYVSIVILPRVQSPGSGHRHHPGHQNHHRNPQTKINTFYFSYIYNN